MNTKSYNCHQTKDSTCLFVKYHLRTSKLLFVRKFFVIVSLERDNQSESNIQICVFLKILLALQIEISDLKVENVAGKLVTQVSLTGLISFLCFVLNNFYVFRTSNGQLWFYLKKLSSNILKRIDMNTKSYNCHQTKDSTRLFVKYHLRTFKLLFVRKFFVVVSFEMDKQSEINIQI